MVPRPSGVSKQSNNLTTYYESLNISPFATDHIIPTTCIYHSIFKFFFMNVIHDIHTEYFKWYAIFFSWCELIHGIDLNLFCQNIIKPVNQLTYCGWLRHCSRLDLWDWVCRNYKRNPKFSTLQKHFSWYKLCLIWIYFYSWRIYW